jgi:hypothetical protein
MRSREFLPLLVVYFLSFVFITACEKSSPPIEEKKFIKVYSEMVFMQDTSFLAQKIIREKVLEKYKIKSNEFEQTVEYYNQEPVRWQDFFDKVTSYIDSLKLNQTKDSTQSDVKSLPKQSLSWDKKNL